MANPQPPTRSADPAHEAPESKLLDLGALVYELHRRGRRAPELLQGKAAELDVLQHELPEVEGPADACPQCHAEAAPNLLVCLDCGHRLALDEARLRDPGPRMPRLSLIAIAVVVALAGAVAFGFALSELTSDDHDSGLTNASERSSAAARSPSPKSGVAGSIESSDGPVALAAWPETAAGYTVILVTSSDETGARKVAWDAARSGLEAGLLRSDDYRDLGEGLWLVVAGRYSKPGGAERAAARLGGRYKGAYVQQVVPTGSG
jgi:hypothetical protein